MKHAKSNRRSVTQGWLLQGLDGRLIGTAGVFFCVGSLGLPINPEVTLVILGITTVIATLQTRSGSRSGTVYVGSPLVIALIAFLGFSLLSILVSEDVHRSGLISLSLVPASLLFLLILDVFELKLIRGLLTLLAALGPGIALILVPVVWLNPGENPSAWMELAGLPNLLVPNDLILLAIVAPLPLGLLRMNPAMLTRLLCLASLVSTLGLIVLFQSRGGLLVLVCTTLCATGLLWPRRFRLSALLLLVTGVVFDALQGFSLLGKLLGVWGTRLPLWAAAWQMFLDAPLLGHGPNAFAVLGQAHLDSQALPAWIPQDPRAGIPWAHNLYLELLAERGLLGAASFVCLLAIAWRSAWRLRKYGGSEEIRTYAASVSASLLGIMAAGLFELTFIRYWFVIVMFAVLAIIQALPTDQKNEREDLR